MEMSPEINELAKALATAQHLVQGAKKDSDNPFFKSKYADLQSVWAACRMPLTSNGLSVVQCPRTEATERGVRVSVETVLLHSSGQWLRDSVAVLAKDDSPQAVGSCISYLRRYSLAAFAGVAPEDDDAEAAEGRKDSRPTAKPVKPGGFDDWLTDLEAVAAEGTPALEAAWRKSKAEYRTYLTAADNAGWEAIKAKAAKVRVAVPA
jgi:hypothetical protein